MMKEDREYTSKGASGDDGVGATAIPFPRAAAMSFIIISECSARGSEKMATLTRDNGDSPIRRV